MRLELTKRADYAIRACIHLALHDTGRPVASRRIAHDMDVPGRFLPHVLADLTGAGIVTAHLGRGGGYRLGRAATALSILDIVEAIEGPRRSTECVLHQRRCDAAHACGFHPTWARAQAALIDVLAGTSLAEIASAARISGTASVSGRSSPERSLE